MSVYKRNYRPYSGPLTGDRSRYSVLIRYALSDVWSSRITNVLFTLCFIPTIISLVYIYIMNNETVRLMISGPNAPPALQINERFFFGIMLAQYWPALALTAWVGPKLISADMSNSALPVILSHPVSRVEYVLAKFTVLAGLLSVVTWLPALLLFGFQSHMSAAPWAASHLQIAFGMFVSGLLWVSFLALFALALAAMVKWRVVATGMIVAGLFVPAGVGEAFNAVLRSRWGSLLNIPFMMSELWQKSVGYVAIFRNPERELPATAMLLALAVIAVYCLLVLNARIRAREVVRG